jgi:poly-gamma-glutamate synthesis protein (capsule biosynthesis protein)
MRADDVVPAAGSLLTLFLCGDVMTGRGVDQVLPHPSDPRLHEGYVKNAREYVELAERAHGPIPAPVDFPYVWGDLRAELAHVPPDVRIVNLETSITRSDDYWMGKGINYRMHPDNVPCLTAARIDCCVANNTCWTGWAPGPLTLWRAGVKTGARTRPRGSGAPAVIGHRAGASSSSVSGPDKPDLERGAAPERPGVNFWRICRPDGRADRW